MSRRVIIAAMFGAIVMASLGCVTAKMIGPNRGASLKLSVSTVPDVNYTVTNIPLKITFENVSEKEVRILGAFKDPQLLLIFFRLNIKAGDGTPIPVLGGGKVALTQESYQYIVLKKGQKIDVVIDGARFLSSGAKLKDGAYDFSVVYQNQYGTDCFQGRVESNIVKINLADK